MDSKTLTELNKLLKYTELKPEQILFFAASKGFKHAFYVCQSMAEGFEKTHANVTEFKDGRICGGSGGTVAMAKLQAARKIHDSAFFSEINYIILHDTLAVADELKEMPKDRPFNNRKLNELYFAEEEARRGVKIKTYREGE